MVFVRCYWHSAALHVCEGVLCITIRAGCREGRFVYSGERLDISQDHLPFEIIKHAHNFVESRWSLYIPPSGHYMYRQFNIQQFYVLPTQCIYVFCVDLRTNSDYFPIQH